MFDNDTDIAILTVRLDDVADDDGQQGLPSGFDEMGPGLFLAIMLESIDPTRLNGHDAVRVLEAEARQVAYYEARRLLVMAEVAYSPPGGPHDDVVREDEQLEFASDEIGAALHLTRRAADSELGFALSLRERLPMVWEALHAGTIDVRRAKVIEDETDHLDETTACDVVDHVLKAAPKLTSGQIRARVQRLSMEVAPDSAKTRYEQSVAERSLSRRANPEGTTNLYALQLPPHRSGAAMRRINRLAQNLKEQGDSRTIDQLRADVFLDLLNGKTLPSAEGGAVVDITVSLESLTKMSEATGHLAGYGPVIADVARQVTAEQGSSEWRFTVTQNGYPIHVGTTSRRPTTSMRRVVEANHRTCVFPGCRMPAINCDLDHRVAVIDGGPTTACNLAPLCRHHHRAKHEAGWRPVLNTDNTLTWVSPLGRHYITDGQSP